MVEDTNKVPDGIEMCNDTIIVTELAEDLFVDGVFARYDSEDPYMFCRVYKTCTLDLNVGDIIVIRRYAKEEFLPGYYFVSIKDIRCKYSEEEYEKLLVK